ncbi:MAG TPA: ElyC/SanA/YdcF family protein [Opitutaceae bacterium]|nr:ElyC/SanA/YdcF family protein [Opitutaceae bacterium]
MFWLKKLLSSFLLPLPLALVCGALGVVLITSRRRQRTARALLTLASLVLLVASNRWVSEQLIAPLESRYPAVGEIPLGTPLRPDLAACRFVVVLGGGHADAEARPALSRLSPSARARLAEGVRLLRLLPAAKLVVSGAAEDGGPTHAQVLADSAVSLGVDRARILLINDARDTAEEAVRLRQELRDAPAALVTSAWHLPRAMALCTAQGLHVLPCPTDFLSREPRPWNWSNLAWDVPSLERTTAAVHERLGLWWSQLRRRA